MQIQKTETPKRILAIKLRELGDTAIWTSALEGLHKLFPQTEIHVLVPPGGKELLLHHPVVKQLHVISSTRALGIILKLIELRKYRFDLALGFHATTSLCRWIRLLGAKRVGLHHHSWTFTPKNSDLSIEKPGFLQGAIARDYELLNCLGWDGPVLSTHLQVLDSERAEATKWLKATKLALDSSRPLLALLPGARAETRRYPKDLWREMALHLQSEGKYQVYVIADANLSREWELSRLCREM